MDDQTKTTLRLPVHLKAWLAATAVTNRRSMSREIEYRLEQAMQAEQSASRETGNQAGGVALRA